MPNAAHLTDIVRTFKNYKALGDGALAQISDADLHTLLGPDSNSIAIIMKHVAGNLRSRFRDFLSTDGEKPDRDRDGEFEMMTVFEGVVPNLERRYRETDSEYMRTEIENYMRVRTCPL